MASTQLTHDILVTLWNEASSQVTDFARTIKMSRTHYNMLNIDGQSYFRQRARELLFTDAGFFADASNPNRVYLGNSADIEAETFGTINWPIDSDYQSSSQALSTTTWTSMPSPTKARSHNGRATVTAAVANDTTSDEDHVTVATNEETLFENKYGDMRPPTNGFPRFRKAEATEIREKNPGINEKEISNIIGNMWKGMSVQEQAPWMLEARAESNRFKTAYPDYYRDRLAVGKRPSGIKKTHSRQRSAAKPQPSAEQHQPQLLPASPAIQSFDQSAGVPPNDALMSSIENFQYDLDPDMEQRIQELFPVTKEQSTSLAANPEASGTGFIDPRLLVIPSPGPWA
ncbi:hypothetical protein F4808DRAFT_467465 [Astrocystis sublimbata]|nr:hypothetical protein F4808DRAFT_467465 [Astrocystis sublimbata]